MGRMAASGRGPRQVRGAASPLTAGIYAPPWVHAKLRRWTAEDVIAWANVYVPPVDPRAIAASLGIFVWDADQLAGIASARAMPGRADLWVRSNLPEVHKRFAIAHQIGHILLEVNGLDFLDTYFGGSPAETRANSFAGELLVPLWMLDAFVYTFNFNAPTLAEVFGVTPALMQHRLGTWAGMEIPYDVYQW